MRCEAERSSRLQLQENLRQKRLFGGSPVCQRSTVLGRIQALRAARSDRSAAPAAAWTRPPCGAVCLLGRAANGAPRGLTAPARGTHDRRLVAERVTVR